MPAITGNKRYFSMKKQNPTILAIESSCDDTAAAVLQNKKLLSNTLFTQIIHSKYGGVVPELASRDHQKNIVAVVKEAIELAKINLSELDCIAYTQGPGLLGSLLVGCCFAKGMALALDKPLIGVNHMQAHVLANFIDIEDQIEFPLVCLTVSGGHTQLVYVKDFLEMKIIGQTLDDAMGEAFDKIGKMMGLPYPAGPTIDEFAQKGSINTFSFPNTIVPDLEYSFSGIKTSFSNFFQGKVSQNKDFFEVNKYDICASIQNKLIDMAMNKFCKAVEKTKVKAIAIAGGVAANSALRAKVENLAITKNLKLYLPNKKYCTDNAAMIAMVAHHKYLAGQFQNIDSAMPIPRMEF